MALTFVSSKEGTSYNSKMKTEYVYENSVYYDDELKKKVYKRRVIGKIDPQTGEKIPTGSVGRPRQERVYRTEPAPAQEIENEHHSLNAETVQALLKSIDTVSNELHRIRNLLQSLS